MKRKAPKRKLRRVGRQSDQLIRWSVAKASREFLIHRETITRQLNLVELRPAKDGCYSGAELLYALADFVRWHWDGPPDRKRALRAEADVAHSNRRAMGRP